MSDKNPTPAQKAARRAERERFGKDEYHWLAHDYGLEMEELTPYQFRYRRAASFTEKRKAICVDIFPSSKKYHDITKKVRGKYDDLEELIKELLS